MSNPEQGRRVWFFPDGDLPPPGNGEFKGHESLIILNATPVDAEIRITVFHEDAPPDILSLLVVEAERVRCIRMDEPIGEYHIATGQYALKVESSVPIICQIGRADVRQANLTYYTVMGFPG